MVTQDQTEIIDFLASPATHRGLPVERAETHASIVFLVGSLAYKLKRAVRYDYLDFSTPVRRRQMCDAELAINRRLAPSIYHRVLPITREANGSLALGGGGAAVDSVIEMARFDQDGLLDRVAARGALDVALMAPLARAIASFHAAAERRDRFGGAASMQWVVDGNDAGLKEQGVGFLDRERIDRVTTLACSAIDAHARVLDGRRDAGLVRQCHGDLHLRNIVLIDGKPTLFDAVEFNDDIACIDVLYDLAFLLMDLWRRRMRRHANVLWNTYLFETGDLEGIALMPLFLSCRSAIRAKTSMTAARLTEEPRRRDELVKLGREYLRLAERLLVPVRPRVIAVGGFSGSGKSTVAQAIAPAIGVAPGAVVIRSDEVRKQLSGVDPFVRLGADAYAPEVSHRVYTTLAARTVAIATAGASVIADAVFARGADRDGIEHAAALSHAPFSGIWLDAPERVLVSRVQDRHADASDADASVIQMQLNAPLETIDWHRIDASRTPAAVVRTALRQVTREPAKVRATSITDAAADAARDSIASPRSDRAASAPGS